MCKFIAIINKNPNNKTVINKFLTANIGQLASEKSGYSVFRDGKQPATAFYPNNEDYNNIGENIAYRGEGVQIIHFRTATCGEQGIGGLHLQPMYSGVFACHNGTVRSFASIKDRNDSLYFFDTLLYEAKGKLPDIKLVEEEGNELGFYGKSVMYQPRTKKMAIFCNQKMYITCFEDCLIFSSYDPELSLDVYDAHNVLGLEWFTKVSEEKIEPLYSTEIDDSYLLLENGVITHKEPIKISWTNNYSYGYNIGNYDQYGNKVSKKHKKDKKDKRQAGLLDTAEDKAKLDHLENIIN